MSESFELLWNVKRELTSCIRRKARCNHDRCFTMFWVRVFWWLFLRLFRRTFGVDVWAFDDRKSWNNFTSLQTKNQKSWKNKHPFCHKSLNSPKRWSAAQGAVPSFDLETQKLKLTDHRILLNKVYKKMCFVHWSKGPRVHIPKNLLKIHPWHPNPVAK